MLNSCITVQILHASDEHRYIPKIKQEINNKLYRRDEVSLFGNIWDQIKIKLRKDFNIIVPQFFDSVVTLSYYHGKFLNPPTKMCMGYKCDVTQLNIKEITTEDYHLKVSYPVSSQTIYVKSEAVEYPAGKDGNRFVFYPIELNPHKDHGSFFWLSSTIYHINCAKLLKETTEWSHLNATLIYQICLEKMLNALPMGKDLEYYLHPPYLGSDHSNIWELKLFFKCISIKYDNYGYLVFKIKSNQ